MKLSPERWDTVNWVEIDNAVSKLQRKIFKASKDSNIKKVRFYQRQMINAYSAKLKAVRRVTQDNKGKSSAGIDRVKNVPPKERFKLAKVLRIPTVSKALRRAWISKSGSAEKRPFGIPTIKGRSLQSLVKLAIEPEWEARFEGN
jgi:RNA-directed DNA polymerase